MQPAYSENVRFTFRAVIDYGRPSGLQSQVYRVFRFQLPIYLLRSR